MSLFCPEPEHTEIVIRLEISISHTRGLELQDFGGAVNLPRKKVPEGQGVP